MVDLVKIISFETGYKTEKIAGAIGYSRAHFSRLINSNEINDNTIGVATLLRQKFDKEIKHFVSRWGTQAHQAESTLEKKVDSIAANLEKILTVQQAADARLWGHIIRSSERYAKEDPATVEAELDKIDSYVQRFLDAYERVGKPSYSRGKVG